MSTVAVKNKAPKMSDLLWERQELRANTARDIAESAIERGGLTRMEKCELKLLAIEQDECRRQWAEYLREEGRRVNLLDQPLSGSKMGLSVTNRDTFRPTVWLYGAIGARYDGGIGDEQFMQEFLAIEPAADVDLRIRSDGGDFYTALAMREVIMSRRGQTHAFIDGLACSAATLIACACTSVTMGIGSRYMIHEASGALDGRAGDFEKAAEQLKKTNATILKIYKERWKGTHAQLLDALHAETWFSDWEAVEWGLADRVSDKLTLAASVSPRHGYKHIPSELTIAAKLENCPRLMAMELAMHRVAIVH